MGNITIHNTEQGSEAWLAARNGKYTGTSAHKLLKYGIVEYSRTTTSTFTGNSFTRRGHLLEPQCLEIYESISKHKVSRPGYVTNDMFPTCLFSPDGMTEDTLLECKAFNEKKHMAIYNGEVPFEILAQIHFGLLITELKAARLLIYNPDLDDPKKCFKIIDIKYNRNIANNFKRILGSANAQPTP